MTIWNTNISFEAIKERNKDTMVDHLGIEFTDIGDDYLVATMPVDHRTKQALGIMHGGASCVLAETVGSVAANYAIDITTHYCVGLDINTNHIRSIKSGFVVGKAQPFHIGRSTQVWDIKITDENEKLISVNRLTMAVMKR